MNKFFAKVLFISVDKANCIHTREVSIPQLRLKKANYVKAWGAKPLAQVQI
jgi:hypothetical protein